MNKLARLALSLTLVLMLTACAEAASEMGIAASAAALSEEYDGAPPVSMQLLAGTLLLEGTEMQIGSEQAAKLVLLWQAYDSLSSSDTAAEAEIDAILDQIQAGMTPEQLEAIAAMRLTQDDLMSLSDELGLSSDASEGMASDGGDIRSAPAEGFTPPEGVEGGQSPGQNAGDLSPDEIARLQAESADGAGPGARAGQFLIQPLLELLQNRAGISLGGLGVREGIHI